MPIRMNGKPGWMWAADGGRIMLDGYGISVWSIATGMAKLCRYGGQFEGFYSVAQHCCLVAEHVPKEFRLEALFHDAVEGLGFGDLCYPWKIEMRRVAAHKSNVPGPVPSQYDEMYETMERGLASDYGLRYPWPAEVLEVDRRITVDEIAALFPDRPHVSNLEPISIKIEPIEDWRKARELWLRAYFNYETIRT